MKSCTSGTTPKRDASTFSSSIPLVLPPTTYSDSDPATITPILQKLDTHLTELHEALPPRTGLVIFTGHDDPRKMADLNARKLVFDKIVKAKQGNAASGGEGEGGGEGGGASILEGVPRELWWTASEARQLEEQVELAKRGLLFLAVKT
jgi:RNA exonuclease 1